MITIIREPPRKAETLELLTASDALMAQLYPSARNHMLGVEALERPEVRFYVARVGGVAKGCGAWVHAGEEHAELKRMFVAPQARGQKIGRRLVDHIEREATAAKVQIMRLETGLHQPEALRISRLRPFRRLRAGPAERLHGKAPGLTPGGSRRPAAAFLFGGTTWPASSPSPYKAPC